MIEYVTIDQAAELDAFVLRQPNCHFMQTSVWGRVKEGWGWTGILCRDEKGEIIGSMAILEHRIRHMHTGFLYAPRGPISPCSSAVSPAMGSPMPSAPST